MSGSRYDRGRDMLYDSSYLALIYPIGHGALADADDSAVVADVLCKALGQYSPELFAVLRAAFGNAELIADALGNVTGTVVLAELIVKITDSAREAYKLIAAKLAEIELFLVLGRNNAGNGADTLNSLGKSDILKQLIKKLNIILNKLVKAVVAVLGNEFVYDINAALGYAVLFGRCLCRIVKAYYLAEYRQTVINGFVNASTVSTAPESISFDISSFGAATLMRMEFLRFVIYSFS